MGLVRCNLCGSPLGIAVDEFAVADLLAQHLRAEHDAEIVAVEVHDEDGEVWEYEL